MLTPLSFFASFYGIGLLGFSPYFTAFSYHRNAVRAWRLRGQGNLAADFATAAVGFLIVIGFPLVLQVEHGPG